MKVDMSLPYHVVDKSSGKILDSFKNKMFANMHYHVKKGWAEVKNRNELKENKMKSFKEFNNITEGGVRYTGAE